MQVYCEELCRAGKGPQALWLVKQTSTVLNHSACLMYMLGSVHYVLHRPMDALAFFAAAVAAKPDCWEAREALENLKAAACDRWHFRMLNDGERNAAYAAALRVARGRTVLDIGTGTGLLAMYAARAGATSVVACDINPIMCSSSVAAQNLARRGTSRVQVVNASSTALGDRGPFDVVVTELVDSGLLGEHIIPTLRRARALLAPGGIMIPRSATVWAGLVQSPYLRARARLGLVRGRLHGICVQRLRVGLAEPYTCEPLHAIPHRLLAGPLAVHTVDLQGRDTREWTQAEADDGVLRESAADRSASGPAVSQAWLRGGRPCGPVWQWTETQLCVDEGGTADCLAVWFDMQLDETNHVSTAPSRGSACGWDQAIVFLDPTSSATSRPHDEDWQPDHVGSLPDAGNGDDGQWPDHDTLDSQIHGRAQTEDGPARHVDAGDVLTLRAGHGDDGLVFALSRPASAQSPGHTVGNQNHDQLEPAAHIVTVAIGEGDMARLNDSQFHATYARAVQQALHGPGSRVLDLADGWSVRPLVLSRLDGQPAVVCVQANAEAARVLTTLQADPANTGGDVQLYSQLEAVSADGVEPFDVLVVDVCDSSGLLVPAVIQVLPLARRLLQPHGTMVPARIVAMAVAVESPWLLQQNQVFAANCAGACVDALNAFGARHYRELDGHLFPHRRLTAATTLGTLDLAAAVVGPDGCVSLGPGECVELTATAGGQVDAILIWWVLDLAAGVQLSTLTPTLDPHSHWRQMAVMVTPRPVQPAAVMRLGVRCSAVHGLDLQWVL